MAYEQGVHMGIGWVRLRIPRMEAHLATLATNRRRTDDTVVLFPPGKGPGEAQIAVWEAGSSQLYPGHYFAASVGLRPFDESEVFPQSLVTYYQNAFPDFDATAWANQVLDVPAGVELTVRHDKWRCRLHACARTLRDGVEADVKRKVDHLLPFREAMEPHLRYFERNCPRVPAGHGQAAACGIHVNALLSRLTGMGVGRVRPWSERLAERRGGPVSLPVAMLPSIDGLAKVVMKSSEQAALALLDVTLRGGTRIQDDEQGTSISLTADLPDAVMGALKGRDATDVVDVPWLRGLTIRSARREEKGILIRAAAPREPLRLPDHAVDDRLLVADMLRRITGEDGALVSCDDDVRDVVARLDASSLLSVLCVLLEDGRATLDEHGLPGWTLKRLGTCIQMDACPNHGIGDLAEAAIAR